MEKKINEISELKNHLIGFAQQNQECSEGSIPLYGQVIDMIKDLAEAEEKCWKACYYKKIVEAMKKEEKEGHPQRFGYDNWRYMSTGEFAPKGQGTYSPGYRPMIPMDMMYGMEPEWMAGPYGYSGNNRRSNNSGSSGNGRGNSGSYGGNNSGGDGSSTSGNYGGSGRYGYPMEDWMASQNPYDRYQESRRHYHESKSPEDRKEMEHHAKEHVEETMNSIRDIWEESSPELRKEMKKNLSSLVNALPA